MFTGWVERWPLQWEDDGTFSEVVPDIVDSFGYLSQTILKAPFYLDVLALGPDFFFPLNDPTGSTVFVDATGKHAAAPVVNSPSGPGTVAAGQSVDSAVTGEGFLGAAGPIVTMTNPNVGGDVNTSCSCINLDSVGVAGVPATGGWTRMIAFRNNGAGTTPGALWYATNASYTGAQNYVYVTFGASDPSSGGLAGIFVICAGPNGFGSVYTPPAPGYADDDWHLLHLTMSANNLTFTVYMDGAQVFTRTTTGSQNPVGITAENVGAVQYPGVSQFYSGYNGDTAHVAQFPYPLTPTQISNLYHSWRTCWAGDSSGQRYQRILTWAGYQGLARIEPGATTNMGPATDLVPTNANGGNLSTTGTDALTALTNVVITESGNHYVAGDGALVFEQRTARYGTVTPAIVLGEDVAGGEIPYEDLAFDYDTTQIGNDVQITQNSTNQVFYAEGAPGSLLSPNSQAQYGTRTLQRTVNAANAGECIDASHYFLYRYGQPDPRVSTLRLHPSALVGAIPNVWATLLGLELGTRVRVRRRPPGFPPIQWDGFVERIEWSMDPTAAYVDLQLSPSDKLQFWSLSAMHTTVAQDALANSFNIILSALPDAAINPFSAYTPAGLVLWFEPGTPRFEALQLFSAEPTVPGYTQVRVELSRPLQFAHPAGAVVCEALAPGQTDPTLWDASSVVGVTTTFSY